MTQTDFSSVVSLIKECAIFILDIDGRVTSWNLGAQQIKGYRADEIIGRHFSQFYTDEDNAQNLPANGLRLARQHGQYEVEGWRVRKDGTRFWANVVISPLRNGQGEPTGFLTITKDLTARNAVQKERTLRQIAQASLREHDNFLSMASHEIRSPLSALKLYIQTTQEELQSGKINRVLEKLPARLRSAQRQIDRIDSLINRLMNASALASGELRLNLDDLDLSELAAIAIADLSEVSLRARSEIIFQTPGAIVGRWSRQYLEDLILDLLQNAIKFGAGKTIDVTVGADDVDAWISVSDHGVGISEADRERIFSRFEHAVDSRNHDGLGLGLWISRRIASAMGGYIHVESRPGEGARVVLSLPRVAPLPVKEL